MRLIIRLLLSALAFTSILPLIPGIQFHGGFMTALLLSIVFGLMLWAVEVLALAIAAIWTIGSFGLALLWLIPLWVVGFWLLPCLSLMLTASVLPQFLSISGFIPAALAAFPLLCVGLLTSKVFWTEKKS
ncbi:MAG: phage holin family protein [Candidatus Obscuribacterales bacterium]|nr:phage holin family protein [Candidatus Obscuribacterales bacterium]